jgi:hypothetical protein
MFGYVILSFVPLGIISMKNKSHKFFLLSSFLIVFLFLSYYGAHDKEVIRLFLPLFFIPIIFSTSGIVHFFNKPNIKKLSIVIITFFVLFLSIELISNLHFENEELYSNITGENIAVERMNLINQINFYPILFNPDIRTTLNKGDRFYDDIVFFINKNTENNAIIIVPVDGYAPDYIRQFNRRYTVRIHIGHVRICNNNFFNENCSTGIYYFKKSILWFFKNSFPVYYLDIQSKIPIEIEFQNQVMKHLNQSFVFLKIDEFNDTRLYKLEER